MKRVFGWMFGIVALGVAAFAFYLWQQGKYTPMQPLPADMAADAPVPPAATAEPAIQFPVPQQEEELPPLERSDPIAMAALADVFGKGAAKQLFQPQEIIRRIVVTIDNLPRKVVSAQLMPTKPVEGKLRTAREGDTLMLAPANYQRYEPFVRLAAMVDAKVLVSAYNRLYPLFQQAYRDLGYPKGYFNDRLVAVIDHMLEAPQSEGNIALVQPHVYYKFVDPQLEALSAGHKLMLRIGNENAATVKEKLQEVRAELVGATPASQ